MNQSYGDISPGVGIRTVKGDQIGYGFTRELTAEPMMPAAETASTSCIGKATPVLHSFNPLQTVTDYPVTLNYSGIPAKLKLPDMKSINVEDKGVPGKKGQNLWEVHYSLFRMIPFLPSRRASGDLSMFFLG